LHGWFPTLKAVAGWYSELGEIHLFAEKSGVLWVGSTLINEKQYFAIFSTNFFIWMCEVIIKYFGGHP
jgi:hypothetical protein